MTFKMKGFPKHAGVSPAKSHKKGHKDQQGPINKPSNKKLWKGEMEGTHVYKGKNVRENIIDFEERASFAGEDANINPGPKRKAALKRQKNLNREADIIRDRLRNTSKKKKAKPQMRKSNSAIYDYNQAKKKRKGPVKPKPGDMKKYSDLEKYDDDK